MQHQNVPPYASLQFRVPRSQRLHEMEWIAVSIGIGLLVSLVFTELFGLNVGGMIVPGYLALYLDQAGTVALTVVAALLTWGCVKALNHWAILFGRRRVVVTMVVGFAVAAVMRSMIQLGAPPEGSDSALAGITVVGFVIPGLKEYGTERIGKADEKKILVHGED